jgi:hypothetical protein
MTRLVKAAPRLDRLDLIACPITDRGLKALEGLRMLKHISLRDTRVSQAGIDAFQKALPECRIAR